MKETYINSHNKLIKNNAKKRNYIIARSNPVYMSRYEWVCVPSVPCVPCVPNIKQGYVLL